ncbi:hypothetical protein Lal_00003713, partial [Lupinus albus]
GGIPPLSTYGQKERGKAIPNSFLFYPNSSPSSPAKESTPVKGGGGSAASKPPPCFLIYPSMVGYLLHRDSSWFSLMEPSLFHDGSKAKVFFGRTKLGTHSGINLPYVVMIRPCDIDFSYVVLIRLCGIDFSYVVLIRPCGIDLPYVDGPGRYLSAIGNVVDPGD